MTVEDAVRTILRAIGEDPERTGLEKTPSRVAESFLELTRGYRESLPEILSGAVFETKTRSMVLVKDIPFHSLCEHHLLPFFGKAHMAYVPDGRLIGLSKIPRIIDHFAHRLQVQERLGEEAAQCLMEALQPRGLGIVLEATHLCMVMRGVQKEGSRAITSTLKGSFLSDARARSEFMALAGLRDPLL